MLRVAAVLLALGVGFDHLQFDGRYREAAERVILSLLRGW
jgi:hypothetical protein